MPSTIASVGTTYTTASVTDTSRSAGYFGTAVIKTAQHGTVVYQPVNVTSAANIAAVVHAASFSGIIP